MKKGQEVIGVVEEVLFPNKGMVRVKDGEETAFVQVKNVIPGQEIHLRITKKRHGNYEGRLLEVVKASPLESAPNPCPHFPECGGCLYQTVPYEEQLKLKERQIRTLLAPVLEQDGACGGDVGADSGKKPADQTSRFDRIYEGIMGSPLSEGYRNKMELTFGDCEKGGQLTLGMHKRGSFYDILPTTECRIQDADMRTVQRVTLDFFRTKGISYYHKTSHEGYLRHLLLRKAKKTGELLVDLVTSSDFISTEEEALLLEEWRDLLLAQEYEGKIVGILHTKNDRLADVVEDQGTEVLYGQDYFTEELLGLSFVITPFSFFQTNSLGAEVLYQKAREFICEAMGELATCDHFTNTCVSKSRSDQACSVDTASGDLACGDTAKKFTRIYDLYSGTGTIAQILSPVAQEVIGVEIVEEAVEAAKRNAALNGITSCRFIAGDVLKVLDDMTDQPDFIVLDPPRDGIHPKALPKILAYGVRHILYISCKATSLARDLPVFFDAGYHAERIALVDLFPGTGNVETVCLLSKLHEAKYHVNVKLDMDELDLTSAEAKVTYKEIEEWVQEHYGFHVTNLNIAQVKQKHGILERENYNKPKSENSRQPGCPEEKVKAIEDALRHFQMI